MPLYKKDNAYSTANSSASWQADRFVNLYVTIANKKIKLGALRLKLANATHKHIIDALDTNQDTNLPKLLQQLTGDYRAAEPTVDPNSIDLFK